MKILNCNPKTEQMANNTNNESFISDLNLNNRKFFCCFCQARISDERIDFIKTLKREYEFDCVDCARKHDTKNKGYYDGLSGISDLNIVRNLGAEQHLVPEEEKDEINESCLNGEEFFAG